MSRKVKNKEFRPGLSHYFRWLIFGVICYLLISYLSTKPTNFSDPTLILGESTITTESFNLKSASDNLVSRIDPQKKLQLDQIGNMVSGFVNNIPTFVDQQIIKFKKDVVTQVYQDVIKSIEKK